MPASHLHVVPGIGFDAGKGGPGEIPVALEALQQQIHSVQVHLHLVLEQHTPFSV